MHEHIGVAIIVFDKTKRKILLGKRKNAYKAGLYGLPGGRVELEESIEQTVRRELKEETNLEDQQITYLGVVRELQITYNFIHFDGEVVNQEPEKCEGWEWFKLDKIPEKILPAHLAAIDLFRNPNSPSLRELV